MTSPLPEYPQTGRRPARFGRILPHTPKGWGALVFCILLTALVIAFLLARTTPGWYVVLDPTDQQVIDLADRAQGKLFLGPNSLHNTLEAVPLGEHQWTISQDELNSYVAIQFANAGSASTTSAKPPQLSGPIIVFTPGKITLAFRTIRAPSGNPNGGVVSIVFSVRSTQAVDGSPAGVIHLDSLWLGSLPVPQSFAQNWIRTKMPELTPALERALSLQFGARRGDSVKGDVENTARLIAAGEPFPLQFKFDRREIVIKEIRVDDGSLTITFIPPTSTAVRPRPGTP